MDENLNSVEAKENSPYGSFGQETKGTTVIVEGQGLSSREDAPPAGIKAEAFAAGPGQVDCSSSKKATTPNLIKCDICLCEMSSDLVLTSHINGSRHKKRMKALEIVANLKAAGERGIDLELDNGSNAYRCEICSLSVNSPQQLEIHLAGAKHKNKMAKEKLLNIMINVTPPTSQAESENNPDSPPLKKRKKDSKSLFCDVCNINLNSETQYEQHVLSKKHLARSKGDNNRKKRVNRLEKKSNFVQNFPDGNRFHGGQEPEKTNSQNDNPTQQLFPANNMNRLHQVHSQSNNRSNGSFNQMNAGGVTNGPSFGNYYQPRPFMNNHRNFGNNFGRLAEMGKFFSKARPHLFNSHPDSVLQASSSKS